MAAEYNATYFETLTGFKWIANRAIELKKQAIKFLVGYEEAIGYTIGDLVRDKDGISALLTFSLLTSKLHSEGRTVAHYLESIYRRYGLYTTAQESLALEPGADAGALGKLLRESPPTRIAGKAIVAISDLLELKKKFTNGTEEEIDLPKSDVLTYYLEDDSRIIVRPSGTEPKLKCYYETIHPISDGSSFSHAQSSAQVTMAALVKEHQAELRALS
jgi:phosphomannomutase